LAGIVTKWPEKIKYCGVLQGVVEKEYCRELKKVKKMDKNFSLARTCRLPRNILIQSAPFSRRKKTDISKPVYFFCLQFAILFAILFLQCLP